MTEKKRYIVQEIIPISHGLTVRKKIVAGIPINNVGESVVSPKRMEVEQAQQSNQQQSPEKE